MSTREYQGWPSWGAWNVALWMSNDESTYNAAMCALKYRDPVRRFVHLMGIDTSHDRTPDGARWSKRSIKLALDSLRDE